VEQELSYIMVVSSAGFTYRLDRLKPRASIFRGPLVKVYNIFNTVIELSYLCCHLRFPVSSTNKTDRHDITEILLKVALITITLTLNPVPDLDIERPALVVIGTDCIDSCKSNYHTATTAPNLHSTKTKLEEVFTVQPGMFFYCIDILRLIQKLIILRPLPILHLHD
jgi:hypothetical protein